MRLRSTFKMAEKITVYGYEALQKALSEKKGTVFVLFSGDIDEKGVSWCPDCEKAQPVIERNLEKAPSGSVFIHCHVGGRTFWKDQGNMFRKDPKLNLRSIPTLLKVGSPQKLEEEQCLKDDLVQMVFEEDED